MPETASDADWTIDEAAGHLAHPSGLYAYYSNAPTATGGLFCVGPFSSYTKRISRDSALLYTRGAIELIERTVPNSYSIWGTYSGTDYGTPHKIRILGEEFDFVANPCFRSTTFLSRQERDTHTERAIAKEWDWCEKSREVTHRLGLRFTFSQASFNRLECSITLSKRTRDLDILHDKLKPLLLKSLCTTAISVLQSFSSHELLPQRQQNRLSIRIGEGVISE